MVNKHIKGKHKPAYYDNMTEIVTRDERRLINKIKRFIKLIIKKVL